MSTSSRAALHANDKPEVRPFYYTEADAFGAPRATRAEGPSSGAGQPGVNSAQASWEQTAHEAGRQAGEAQARAQFEALLQQLRASVARALEDFVRERATYYQQVEGEVVQLALSIARKILHREAQVDPLLLAGIVRVALDQIENNTKTTIRVHPQRAADWREFFARHADPQNLPEIVDDPTLNLEGCVLQTQLGTTELGIEVQLKEIEQGMLDLLAQRPRMGA